MSTIVEIDHLRKKFGRVLAVDVDNLAVHQGEICGLIGANGAGKTTLLRLIAGLAHPTAGTVTLNIPASVRPMGCLLEVSRLDDSMTLENLLEMYRLLYSLVPDDVHEVVQAFNIEKLIKKRIGALSLGMRQSVALALAFMGHPKLILLDEPNNGLDPENVRLVRRLIHQWNADYDCSFLISSHLLDELCRTMTTCILMKSGRVKRLEQVPRPTQETPATEEAILGMMEGW